MHNNIIYKSIKISKRTMYNHKYDIQINSRSNLTIIFSLIYAYYIEILLILYIIFFKIHLKKRIMCRHMTDFKKV